MPKASGRLWLRAAGSLFTLALLAWLLSQQGWERIAGSLQRIPPGLLALAFALTLLSRLGVWLRWHALLRSAGEPAAPGQSARITFAGLFASNFLPTTVGGDVVRLAGAVQLGFSPAASAASLVADRLVGMAGMLAVLPWGIGPFLAAGGQLTGPAGSAWLAGPRRGLRRGLRRFFDTFQLWRRRPGALALSFGFTLLYMLCKFTAIWLMLRSMGQPIPWMLVAGVWSLVYFVTLLPVSINGYGLQEVSVTLLYASLGGITQDAAVTIALLVRTMEMAASLPGALFVPGILAAQRARPAAVEQPAAEK